MARTAAKRKSESALPTGKSKHRKTEDDSESAGDDDYSDQLFVHQPVTSKDFKKSSLKPRKSEPIKVAARADEYDEDEGRLESRQFLALVEFETKKKKRAAKAATDFLDKFEGKISSAEESLKKRLGDLSIEASKRDSDFNDIFRDAYAASRPLPSTANGESQAKGLSQDISFATLYSRTLEIIDGAKLIVKKFETARLETNKVEAARLIDNDWGDEIESAARILASGYKVGLEKHEALLMGAEQPEIEEEDLIYADLIYPETEGHTSVPWGGIARKGEKVMRKLVKAIVIEAV